MDSYSSDEGFALVVSIIVVLVTWLTWYSRLGMVGCRLRAQGPRWPLAWTPPACALLLYVVLARWSAEDVRTDPAYMFFYMVLGLAWLGIVCLQLPLFGLSARDDVLERGNAPAAWAISGALIGTMCCFVGGNVGNGPGWWVVLFSGWLSTTALLNLWWVIHVAAGLPEKVTVDREPSAGLRAAGFFIGAGLILGRSVAGDWVSAGATLVDFARMGWPAAVLAAAVIMVERSCRTESALAPLEVGASGWVPALAYVGTGIGVMLAW